jgi:hypothetical protein
MSTIGLAARPRDRGRPDVLNAQGLAAQDPADALGGVLEASGPLLVVVHNRDRDMFATAYEHLVQIRVTGVVHPTSVFLG